MSEEKSDVMNLMSRRDVNKSALLTTLDGINLMFWDELWDKYTTVNCQDGSKAYILKDPLKAFEIYGQEWDSKLKIVLDVFNKLKAEGEIELKKKIEKIFENLNYIEATLREMYKNAYLTFAGNPCSKENQEAKRKADRIITAASLFLVTIKIISETQKNLNSIDEEIMKMINRLIDIILC